jgi:hypothetical protein
MKTAIEFLVQRLAENGIIHSSDISKAKAMEKEQIMDAYWDGGQDVPMHVSTCEQYYNETFKSE